MDAYRDQYATLFGENAKVTLLAISVDPDTMLAAWAREKGYGWKFLSDSGARIGRQYGAILERPNRVVDNRTLFIIDPKGKIAHVMAPFREVDPTAYTELGAMVKKISGGR
jgi:peroxiredoxin